MFACLKVILKKHKGWSILFLTVQGFPLCLADCFQYGYFIANKIYFAINLSLSVLDFFFSFLVGVRPYIHAGNLNIGQDLLST